VCVLLRRCSCVRSTWIWWVRWGAAYGCCSPGSEKVHSCCVPLLYGTFLQAPSANSLIQRTAVLRRCILQVASCCQGLRGAAPQGQAGNGATEQQQGLALICKALTCRRTAAVSAAAALAAARVQTSKVSGAVDCANFDVVLWSYAWVSVTHSNLDSMQPVQ
jgi:hypothetical protein